MKVEKQTSEYTIYKRNDGRYAVQGANKQFINGEDKVKVLVDAGLIKQSAPNPDKAAEAEAPAEEAAAE